jgi:cobalamin biosynthesis protein CobW
MPAKIPATVVTGFLGAGKTTLIRHMLENANGKRIALIINEFGDLGVDGGILKGCGIEGCADEDVMELSNGCICCTVADDFIPTMQKLLDRETAPDHIVIETSGLALPQPLVRAFNWPEISTRVTVDGVVTVVDGKAVTEGRFAHDVAAVDAQRAQDENLDHETPLSELFADQVACADMIVVNKADLLAEAEAAELVDRLRRDSRDGVQVIKATMGALPLDVLLGQGVGAETDMDARHEIHHHHGHDDDHDDHDHDHDHHHDHDHDHDHDHHHHHHHHHDHDHDAFESFVVTRPEIADPARFAAQVADVIRAHDILRLKGFAAVEGKPMRLTLQAVGPRVDSYFDRPFGTEARETRLVVIGQAGLDRAAIERALSA